METNLLYVIALGILIAALVNKTIRRFFSEILILAGIFLILGLMAAVIVMVISRIGSYRLTSMKSVFLWLKDMLRAYPAIPYVIVSFLVVVVLTDWIRKKKFSKEQLSKE